MRTWNIPRGPFVDNEGNMRGKMKIWNTKAGPFEDDEGNIWNVCLVETDEGELIDEEIYYENMADAMKMVDYFLTKIDPITLEVYSENPLNHS